MAIGNQLDLQIVINGYNQAQSSLQRLGDSFGNLGQAVANYNATATQLAETQLQNFKDSKNHNAILQSSATNLQKFNSIMSDSDDEATGLGESFRDVHQIEQQLTSQTFQLKIAFASALQTFGSVAYELGVNLVGSLRQSAIEMQQLQIQLRTIGKVSEDTTESLRRLVEISKLPGIDFQSAVRGVVMLRATGVSAELAESAIMNLGNALASVGAEPSELHGVVRAFSQIQSKGKVYAEEIYQIAERLPQIRQIMLDVIGTADTELLAKEGYSANRFLQLITQGLSQLPRVTENIRNELSNLKNEIFFMSAGIGKLLLPTLKHVTNAITTVVKMINGWSDAKKSFYGHLIIAVTVLGALVAIMGTATMFIAGVKIAMQTLGGSASQAGAQMGGLNLQTKLFTAQSGMATGASIMQSKGLKALTVSAGQATIGMKALAWAMKGVLVLSVVGIILVVADLILQLVRVGKGSKETGMGMKKLSKSIDDTNKSMGQLSVLKALTSELRIQTQSVMGLKESYDKASKSYINFLNQKGVVKASESDATIKGESARTPQDKEEKEALETFQTAQQKHSMGERRLKDMTTKMYKMLGDISGDHSSLFDEFTAISETGDKVLSYYEDINGTMTQVLVEGDNVSEEYGKWIKAFEKRFGKLLENDLATFTTRWHVLNTAIKKAENDKRTQPGKASPIKGDKSHKLTEFPGYFARLTDAEGSINEAVLDALYPGRSKISGYTSGTLLEQLDKSAKELENMDGFISVAKKTMVQTNRDLQGGFPDKTKAVSQALAEYSIHNGKFMEGLITIIGDADIETLKLLEGSLLSPEAGQLHAGGEKIKFQEGTIHILFRGLSDLKKAKERLANWMTENPLSTAKEDKDLKKQFLAVQRLHVEINSAYEDISSYKAGDRKEADQVWKQIQSLQKAIKTLRSDEEIILVTNEVSALLGGIDARLEAEKMRITAVNNALKRVKSVSVADLIDLYKVTAKPATDTDLYVKQIQNESQSIIAKLESEKNNVNQIQDLASEGLNSVAKLLVTDLPKGLLQTNAIVEKFFMKEGEYSQDRVNQVNGFIADAMYEGVAWKGAYEWTDEDNVKHTAYFKRYDKIKNPAKLFTMIKQLISASKGGSEFLLQQSEALLSASEINKEIVAEQLKNDADAKRQWAEAMKSVVQFTQEGYIKEVTELILDSETVKLGFQSKIDEENLKIEARDKDKIRLWETRIIQEEALLNTRLNTLAKEEEATLRSKKIEQDKLKFSIQNLQTQQIASRVIDQDKTLKGKMQDLEINKQIFDIEEKQTELRKVNEDMMAKYVSLEEDRPIWWAEINSLMEDSTKYSKTMAEMANKLGKMDGKHEDYTTALHKFNTFMLFQSKRKYEIDLATLGLTKQELEARKALAIIVREQEIASANRYKDEKRTSELAKVILQIKLQELKNKSGGRNSKEQIQKEYDLKMSAYNLDKSTNELERKKLKEDDKANTDRLDMMNALADKKFNTWNEQEKLDFKSLDNLKLMISDHESLHSIVLNQTDAWKKAYHQMLLLEQMSKLFKAQMAGAFANQKIEDSQRILSTMTDTLGRQVQHHKLITKEVSDQHKFNKQFGGVAFGFGEIDESLFKGVQSTFKNWFGDVDPSIIAELSNMTKEMDALSQERIQIGNTQFKHSDEKQNKLDEVTAKEEAIYKRFNDNYRSYLNELKRLSDERFNNAKSHAQRMLDLTKESDMLDVANKYAGKKMTSELESEKLQEELDIKAKGMEDKYKLDMAELNRRKQFLPDFKKDSEGLYYADLDEDQKQWLRDKGALNKQTDNAYKELENTAKAHNLRFSGSATKADKFNNKLGSNVVKEMQAREDRSKKHHASLESMERKHQREMQKYLDQDGQILADKAKKFSQMQFKYSDQLGKINRKFRNAQAQGLIGLEEDISASHTGKGGMPVELLNFIRDRRDEDEAEIYSDLGKTREDHLRYMRQDIEKKTKPGWFSKTFKKGKAEIDKQASKQNYESDLFSVKRIKDMQIFKAMEESGKLMDLFGDTAGDLKAGDQGTLKKIAETIATFKELQYEPEGIKRFMGGLNDFDHLQQELKKRYDSEGMTALQKAEEKAVTQMEGFTANMVQANVSMVGLKQSVNSLGAKIKQVTDSLSPHNIAGKIHLNNIVNVSVVGNFDLDQTGKAIFRQTAKNVQANITPGVALDDNYSGASGENKFQNQNKQGQKTIRPSIVRIEDHVMRNYHPFSRGGVSGQTEMKIK